MSISAEAAAAPAAVEHVLGPPSGDRAARWRRGIAVLAALLVHAGVMALFLFGLPLPQHEAEPAAIPVELVMLPPKPPPLPLPRPEVEPPPKPPERQPLPRRESGGDPDLAPGRVSETPHQPEPVPPPPAAPERPLPAPEPPAEAVRLPAPAAMGTPAPLPVPPPLQRPRVVRELAAIPPKPPAESQPPSESELVGKGGGDRYLNKVRDKILANLIYPGSARSQNLAGVVRFELVVDRQGRLLHVRLLHSSGADMLDRAGRDAVELGAPFGPPPVDVPGDHIGLELTLYIGPDMRNVE